jgi:hypothetical protein
MAADANWIDTLRQRGFGRRIAASNIEVEGRSAGITRFTSDVRRANAIRQMDKAQTQADLVAIKEAAKPRLLERDLPSLKEAYEKRKKYLRSIPTNSTTP